MPRISRTSNISSYLHIMVQGINKEEIFKTEYYKSVYLKYLREESKKNNVSILVYSIMNNHAHLIIYQNNKEDISKVMNVVNSKFAKLYNNDNNRVGYVFRDRFKSVQINDIRQLYATIVYIHNNPVKAKIVEKFEEYKFSSYKDFINGKKTLKEIYLLFGTKEYMDIFLSIHEEYRKKEYLLEIENTEKEDWEDIIEEYMYLHGIQDIGAIKEKNNLLIELVLELRKRAKLKDREICKILGIGKNRIYLIMNKDKNI